MPCPCLVVICHCTLLTAGIPAASLPSSGVLPAFVATCELLYPLVFLNTLAPRFLGFGVATLATAAALAALPAVHWALHVSDPGFVASTASHGKTLESGRSALLGLGKIGSDSNRSSIDSDTPLQPASAFRTPAKGDPGDEEQQAGGPLDTKPVGPGDCWTCRAPRPLRAKHCPLCGRCVARMDHHCFIIWNCVGAGNQRLFVGYLALMALCQALVVHSGCAALLRAHAAAALLDGAAGALVSTGGSAAAVGGWQLLAALAAAASNHQGILLMTLLQACKGIVSTQWRAVASVTRPAVCLSCLPPLNRSLPVSMSSCISVHASLKLSRGAWTRA